MSKRIEATGGCLCGRVRFSCSGQTVHSLVCHCRMCQRASGSAFMGLMFFDTANLRITQGETRAYDSGSGCYRHW